MERQCGLFRQILSDDELVAVKAPSPVVSVDNQQEAIYAEPSDRSSSAMFSASTLSSRRSSIRSSSHCYADPLERYGSLPDHQYVDVDDVDIYRHLSLQQNGGSNAFFSNRSSTRFNSISEGLSSSSSMS